MFRSSKHIYAQVIDDAAGRTLAAASTSMRPRREAEDRRQDNDAAAVGKLLAERALAAGVTQVVFDRGAYLYHGRVKALADAAREGGLISEKDESEWHERTGAAAGGKQGRQTASRASARKAIIDKLVSINRVAKVVKGGRRFAFAALMVVGDQKGRVGYGAGKAREVPEAIRKATERAKRAMIRVPMKEGRTLHHDVEGHFGAGNVILRPRPAPASSPAARCARCSRRSACRTWSPSRSARPTRTTWSRRRSTR